MSECEREVIELPDNKISTLLRLCKEKGIEVDQECLDATIKELELVA